MDESDETELRLLAVRRRARRLLGGTWAAVSALTLLASALGVFHTADLTLVDARFAVRGTERPDSRLVLVEIDARSLRDAGTYPLPRGLHARLVDRLRRAGAGVIVYDVVFAESSVNRNQDDRLARSISRSGNVVLAAAETGARGQPNVLGGDPTRFRALAGSANFPLDPQGVIRRVSASVDGLRTLATVAAARFGGRVEARSFGRDGTPIDFSGPEDTYPAYSFTDVLRGQVPARAFRGRIVVVGASDANLLDVHPTSSSPAMAGPEIQANAIATVLRGLPLRVAPGWLSVSLVIAFAGVVPLTALRRSPRLAVGAAVVVVLGWAAVAQFSFSELGSELPLAAPWTAVAATLPLTLLVAYLSASHEHELAGEKHERAMLAARRRALEAADQARRAVERDVHDGAQQKLLALALDLGSAQETSRTSGAQSAEALDEMLGRARERVLGAVADLRTLARGAYPAVLVEGGLDAALQALVEGLPAAVRLSGAVGARLNTRAEAVAYFFVSESVANALKHAGGTRIEISVKSDPGLLLVEVRDDGRGGASIADGSGLQGLRERVEAYGGRLWLRSRPREGTTVGLKLPYR